MTDQEIIDTIKNAKTAKEIYDTWKILCKDSHQLYRVEPLIHDSLAEILLGRDPRFPENEVEKYWQKQLQVQK